MAARAALARGRRDRLDQLRRIDPVDAVGEHDTPVAEHRDAIGDCEDLAEKVRDVENR